MAGPKLVPRPKVYANPPPLPENVSERLRKQINTKTGCCSYHPKIMLVELIDNDTRWIVRRKTCHMCGARPGAVGGKHHMPGRSIVNPSQRLEREKSRRSSRSSRSSGSSCHDFD